MFIENWKIEAVLKSEEEDSFVYQLAKAYRIQSIKLENILKICSDKEQEYFISKNNWSKIPKDNYNIIITKSKDTTKDEL